MHSIAWWPTVGVLVIAAAIDVHSRRIPNWLVLPFLVGGIVVNGMTRGLKGIGESLTAIGIAVVVLGVLCHLKSLGMGDLKLLAAVGAWIGPSQLAFALVATGIAGGLLAVAYALWHGSLMKSLDGAGDVVAGICRTGLRPHHTVRLDNPAALKIPYAVAIAVGTLFSFYAG